MADTLVEPPASVPPERLFRILTTRPRPVWPIAWRFADCPDDPLEVRAVTSYEVNDAIDAAQAEPEVVRGGRITTELVARALLSRGQRVFASVEDALDLPERELAGLTSAVVDALAIVSPLYGRWFAQGKWHEVLVQGARHHSNRLAFLALADCVDVVSGFQKPLIFERPERYWGCPQHELTDGQWMAFRACVNRR